jgi:hypothetical protein
VIRLPIKIIRFVDGRFKGTIDQGPAAFSVPLKKLTGFGRRIGHDPCSKDNVRAVRLRMILGVCLLTGFAAATADAAPATADVGHVVVAAVTQTGDCGFTFSGGQWAPNAPAAPRHYWHLFWGLGPTGLAHWVSVHTFCITFALPYAKKITQNPDRLPGDKITDGPVGWTCQWIAKATGSCTRYPKGTPNRQAFGFFPAPLG